jgi:hypothetical protein
MYYIGDGSLHEYLSGPGDRGLVHAQDSKDGKFALYHIDQYRKPPIAWVAKNRKSDIMWPVYEGDVIYHHDAGKAVAIRLDDDTSQISCHYDRWPKDPPCGGCPENFSFERYDSYDSKEDVDQPDSHDPFELIVNTTDMNLLDYFAGQVLSGYVSTDGPERGLKFATIEENDMAIAEHCYIIAKNMLKVRQKYLRNE